MLDLPSARLLVSHHPVGQDNDPARSRLHRNRSRITERGSYFDPECTDSVQRHYTPYLPLLPTIALVRGYSRECARRSEQSQLKGHRKKLGRCHHAEAYNRAVSGLYKVRHERESVIKERNIKEKGIIIYNEMYMTLNTDG